MLDAVLWALAGLSMAQAGKTPEEGARWPEHTVMLIAGPEMLILGDPGPGWRPDGEPEDSPLRQLFYYHGTANSQAISMALIETDCSVPGKWRMRASSDMTPHPEAQGSVIISRQQLASRTSVWSNEEGDAVGMAVWENTCHGQSDAISTGELTPWAAAQLWYEHQRVAQDPDEVVLPEVGRVD